MLIKAGEIISQSIKLYRKHFKLFVTFAAIMFVPSAVLQAVVTSMGMNLKNNGGMTALILLLGLAVAFVNFWLSIGFVRVMVKAYKGEKHKTIGEEIIGAKKYFWSVLLASILAGLAIIGGTILLIIPGIIFSIWFAFVMYSVIFEDKKGAEALKASKALVSGRWWGVLWRLLAPGIVFGIITMVVQWIASLVFFVVDPASTIGMIIATVFMTAAAFLVLPVTTAAPTILYVNLKKTPVHATTPEAAAKEM